MVGPAAVSPAAILDPAASARSRAAGHQADVELRALLRRVRHVELKTKKAVNAAALGAWHARFRGRGMAFSESRAYVAGDDPRHVDWLASARTGDLYVKQFVEERELTVLLAVDLSGSMATGSLARNKRQVAVEAAALLAFAAVKNQDKVGLVGFTDRIELLVRPKKGRAHVLRLLREILAFEAPRSGPGSGTDLALAAATATHLSRQRAIVALLTDLSDPRHPPAVDAPLGQAERPLKVLAKRHDLILVDVTDPLERELPNVGLLAVRDPETGQRAVIDTSDPRVRKAYADRAATERRLVDKRLDALGVDRVQLLGPAKPKRSPGPAASAPAALSDDDAAYALTTFLRRRARAGRAS